MKRLIILFAVHAIVIINAYTAEISGGVGSEYHSRKINSSSVFNPGNVNKENSMEYKVKGSLLLKNEFDEKANGMIKLEAEHCPAAYRKEDEGDKVKIKELYLDILHEYFSIRAGKQFLKWGDCAFFNISDVVNVTRDPLKEIKDAEGISFAQLSIPVMSFAAFDFIGIVKDNEADSSSEVPVCFKISASGQNISGFVYVMKEKERNPVQGYSFSVVSSLTNQTSLSVYSEGYFSTESRMKYVNKDYSVDTREKSEYFGAAGGFRLNINFPTIRKFDKLEFTAECCFNNENLNSKEFSRLIEAARTDIDFSEYYAPYKASRCYGYACVSLNNFIIYSATFSLGSVYNFSDKSCIVLPSLKYAYTDNIDLEVKSELYFGDSDSEFGNALSERNISFSADLLF
ncbi:MAG TPA: hypothetical protein PLH15_06140 [Spirochaetota bacterium]|nr:hypothetical protein [Spirochaetota bacterium]